MLHSLQIRKSVLVGLAGACVLASAGCEPNLAGEYDGKVTIDAKHINGSPAHVSITKGDGSEIAPGEKRLETVKVTGADFKDCTFTVVDHSKKGMMLHSVEDGCKFTTGGSLPKGAGIGTLDGTKIRFDFNGTLPLSFEGERAK